VTRLTLGGMWVPPWALEAKCAWQETCGKFPPSPLAQRVRELSEEFFQLHRRLGEKGSPNPRPSRTTHACHDQRGSATPSVRSSKVRTHLLPSDFYRSFGLGRVGVEENGRPSTEKAGNGLREIFRAAGMGTSQILRETGACRLGDDGPQTTEPNVALRAPRNVT
jgi:hypothetical protein